MLENLGQLFRHDLSESYGLLPNPDGAGAGWHTYDGPPADGRPPDRFLAFDTTG